MELPRIGVACWLETREKRVLIGKRKNSHGSGLHQLPGGHLDFGETMSACATRELAEETGIVTAASDWTFLHVTENIWVDEKRGELHYITLFMKCCIDEVEPQLLEPEKCEFWRWMAIQDLHTLQPLFHPLESFIQKLSQLPPIQSGYSVDPLITMS